MELEQNLLHEQQWIDLEQRFQRFELSLAEWRPLPLEVEFTGKLQEVPFEYLDDKILASYDDVIFPDFTMFPALPPLDVWTPDDHVTDQCQQVVGTVIKEQRSEEDHKLGHSAVVANRGSQIRAKSWARTKSDELRFGDLQKYFDRPILEASKELKVGVTLLKKRCRELGIRRWPHRKLRSLKCLINNVKELGLDQVVTMLEEQRKMLVNQPEMELNDEAKKIRQKSFKANHVRRRKMGVVCVNL